MPRRKLTASSTTTTTKTPPSKPHKRQLSTSATPTATTTTITPGSRQSKRVKASMEPTPTVPGKEPSTPKKSKYFDGPDSDDDDEDNDGAEEDDDDASGYEEASASALSASPSAASSEAGADDDDGDAYVSDDVRPRRRAGKKQAVAAGRGGRAGKVSAAAPVATGVGAIVEKGKELWRQGVKAGLGPGKAVFIEKPKPREDGGVKYVPDRIHPNTMAFLEDLKQNNEREWMKMHDIDYRTAWKDWESFVESLTEKIMEKDDTIPELPPKDLVFRVYRDIRFSPDPTPYKPFFSAAWSRTGRKGPYAGYYVQIAPGGKSFVGCGLWMPEAAPLALLRTDIDRTPQRIKSVLMEPGIRKQILGDISKDERKTVKAFVSQNGENALKTKPKGYDADNPNIDLLRLKNFTIGTKLKDEEVAGPGCLDRIAGLVGSIAPFVSYLNSVIMPDHDEEEEEGEEEEEDGDEEQTEEDEPSAAADASNNAGEPE